jgi:hypothetical protein
VNFKLLIQVQDYYIRQRSNFSIKGAVSKDPLVYRMEAPTPKGCFGKFQLGLYKFIRMIYTSVYFYFFPLFVLLVPFSDILDINNEKRK